MKIAVVGSRGLSVKDLAQYLPAYATELVSGGAKGIDACAREYACQTGMKWTESCRITEDMGRLLHYIET